MHLLKIDSFDLRKTASRPAEKRRSHTQESADFDLLSKSGSAINAVGWPGNKLMKKENSKNDALPRKSVTRASEQMPHNELHISYSYGAGCQVHSQLAVLGHSKQCEQRQPPRKLSSRLRLGLRAPSRLGSSRTATENYTAKRNTIDHLYTYVGVARASFDAQSS